MWEYKDVWSAHTFAAVAVKDTVRGSLQGEAAGFGRPANAAG